MSESKYDSWDTIESFSLSAATMWGLGLNRGPETALFSQDYYQEQNSWDAICFSLE